MAIDPLELNQLDLHAATATRRKKGMLFIALACSLLSFAMSIQSNSNANFVAREMNLSGREQGTLESCRETCGIIALGILAILAGLSEPIIAAAMLALVGIGIGAYSFVPGYFWLIAASMVWSQGLHVWMPLPNSMTLSLSEPGQAGRRLGQIAAASSAGAALALLAGWGLTRLDIPIRHLYLVGGAAAILAGACCLGIPRDIKGIRPRLVFRKRYGMYYLMCFLEGWRKQVSLAFAGFLLVRKFDIDLETMFGLGMAIQVSNWIAAPRVGRLIDRIGERGVLMTYFVGLAVFFTGYALITNRIALCVLYVLDSSFFLLGMGLTTYVNRIVPKEEHTPTLSMGVAMNHVAAVSMPFIGGLIWASMGYQWVFLLGASAAAASVFAAARLPKHVPSPSSPSPSQH
ncbi:MAG: MFS transporter [Planctomycetota bacterium]|nr:MFS transporter [Planctomycetota bacterium]